MKKKNYVLLYDDTCPLCKAYTKGFVKAGLLEADSRKAFSSTDKYWLEKINIKEAVNQIPLIDTANDRVYYGIDALLEILSQQIPFIRKAGNFPPVKWLLLRLYKFISYNRKVIVASQPVTGRFDCSPDFNLKYRILFLLVFFIFNTFMLFPLYQHVITKSMFANSSLLQLQSAHGVLVIINIALAFSLPGKEKLEYLGQVNMLALLVILLTIPLMLLNKYSTAGTAGVNDFLLGTITCFILREYYRRMRYAGIASHHSWIIYVNAGCLTGFLLYLFI